MTSAPPAAGSGQLVPRHDVLGKVAADKAKNLARSAGSITTGSAIASFMADVAALDPPERIEPLFSFAMQTLGLPDDQVNRAAHLALGDSVGTIPEADRGRLAALARKLRPDDSFEETRLSRDFSLKSGLASPAERSRLVRSFSRAGGFDSRIEQGRSANSIDREFHLQGEMHDSLVKRIHDRGLETPAVTTLIGDKVKRKQGHFDTLPLELFSEIVAHLDDPRQALRVTRFRHLQLAPRVELCNDALLAGSEADVEPFIQKIDHAQILPRAEALFAFALNAAGELLIDRDSRFGHSACSALRAELQPKNLKNIGRLKTIPLLEQAAIDPADNSSSDREDAIQEHFAALWKMATPHERQLHVKASHHKNVCQNRDFPSDGRRQMERVVVASQLFMAEADTKIDYAALRLAFGIESDGGLDLLHSTVSDRRIAALHESQGRAFMSAADRSLQDMERRQFDERGIRDVVNSGHSATDIMRDEGLSHPTTLKHLEILVAARTSLEAIRLEVDAD